MALTQFNEILTAEVWRDVPGHEGRYRVSNRGRVIGPSGKVLKFRYDRGGYRRVVISAVDGPQHRMVHRLVLLAFVGPCPDGKEVNHRNSVRTDNRLENLEYVTRLENAAHREAFGKSVSGEGNPRARLTLKDVEVIRERRRRGDTLAGIAADYGVHQNTIWWAVSGRTWNASASLARGG